MNRHRETLMKFISAQNQKLQDDISKQGYKNNSPYRDNPFNIIQGTPQGTSITMDNVSKRLYATDGQTSKILEPNSGEHFFSGPVVKEIALSQTGGPTSDIKSWFAQHMQSPVYRRNLERSGYKDVDAEIANRLSNIDKTKYIVDENRFGTYYNPGSRYIHHSPLKDIEHWKGNAPESESILAHEFGHSGVAKGSGTRLNKYDIDQLGSRNKNKKSYPQENYADQKALQYEAAKLGIYNPDTEEFTQEHLNKLKNTGHKSRALENYSDEDLIWLMNNIAQVDNQSQLPTAQFGADMKFWRPVLQKGGDVLPDDYDQFIKFNESLPDNLRDDEFVYGDPNQYDLYGMWESVGKPASFKDVKDTEHFPLQDDGYYHGFSVNPRSGQFLKPKGHGTIGFEVLTHALTPGSGKDRFLIENEKGRLQYINKEKNNEQFQDGGTKKPIYVKSENDPRYRAYQDSLGLYKHTLKLAKNNKNTKLDIIDRNKWSGWSRDINADNFDRLPVKNPFIEPVKIAVEQKSEDIFGKPGVYPVYVKPKQEVIFQRPQEIPITNFIQPVSSSFNLVTSLPATGPVAKMPKYYDVTDRVNQNFGGSESSYKWYPDSGQPLQELAPAPYNTRTMVPHYQMGGAGMMYADRNYQVGGNTADEIKYGTPEYEEAYNRGEVITEDGQRSPILLDEVVVQGRPLTEFGKTRKEIANKYTWEQYANDRLLGNFEKNMGQTLQNLPEYRKQEYEDYINKLAFDEYVKTHPTFKGEKRGAYIDRMQTQNANSSNFQKAYEANAAYNDATDVNKWRKFLVGLGSIFVPKHAMDYMKQHSDYYSTKEKQAMRDNPISTYAGDILGTLEPLTIPVESLYGNKSFGDIASGQSADIPMSMRILGDPMMAVFEAAPLLGAGFKTAGRLLGTEEGLLSNAYKINPRAFKPNPESFYRQIGNEGLADAVSSNTIRSANQSVFLRPHFVEGSDFTKLYSTGEGATGSRPSVIFETSGLNHVGEPFLFPANSNSGYTPWVAGDAIVPLSEGRILQKDWLQGYKPVQFPTSSVNVVENVTQKVSPTEWQLQKLPGLHLKSTMSDGAVSKIVEPKTGLVNVEQALAIIGKESSGSDKVGLIKQALGENIPKKMDYNQFRKIVQDQLIPLEQQFSIKRSDFGIESIGYTPKVQGTAFDKFSAFMNTPLSELFGKPKLLENKTIIFGNANKFGRGSSAHGNPEETLGHIHFLIDSKTPNTLTVTQIQSDAFQGTHRMMPKNIEDAMIKLEDVKGFKKDAYETFGDDPEKWKDVLDKADKTLNLEENHIKNFMQKSLLDKNHQERYIQELVDYAGKRGDINKVRLPTSETAVKIQNYTKDSQYELESKLANLEYRFSNSRDGIIIYNDNKGGRYIKDADGNYLYKREFGNSNSKTISEDEFNNAVKSANDEIARLKESLKNHTPDYTEKQKTILKKYSEQPKIIKKLFGQDVKIVKDSKGNTWYEFDIPETFKQGQGEIQAFNQGGELPKAQFGSPFGLPVARTIANKIVSWFSDDEKKPVVRPVPVERTFHIKDPRTIRATTQQPIRPTADLLSGTYNSVPLDKTLREAKRRGLSKNDMWNLAGMALAETGLGNKSSNIGQVVAAPFEEGTPGPYEFVDAYINKMKEADKLGIKDPAMRLQVYNGLGPITPNTEKNIRGYKMQKAYGVPLPKEGISMKKRPLYGINVLDAQNNVLKKNPEFVRYIDSIYKAPVYEQGGFTGTKQEDPLSWFMS